MIANPISTQSRSLLYVSAGILVLLIALLAFAVPFSTGHGDVRVSLATMLRAIWSGPEDWQHCFLVIPLCLGMIYLKRKELAACRVVPSNLGLIPLVLSLCLYWLGYRMDVHYVGYFSLQLFVFGYITTVFGWQVVKVLIFPILFLFFAWPLPLVDNYIAFPLRIAMSNASVAVLNLIGIPVILQGTGILSAPDALTGMRPGQRFSVDVADPCSGIRSLFALMMVSALYGYFTLKEWWQKWFLFLCSMPLAILGNLCRILMLTFGTMAMGPAVAIGTLENPSLFHMAAGYLVFAVALGGMIGIGWLLQSLPNWIGNFRNPKPRQSSPKAESQQSAPTPANKAPAKRVDPY